MPNSIEAMTVVAAAGMPTKNSAVIKIGDNKYYHTTSDPYWVTMYDRTSLKQVLDLSFMDNSRVPTEVANHAAASNLIMVLCTSGLDIHNVPHGPLAKYLYKQGAGYQLAALQQVSTAFGSGVFYPCSYIFIGVPSDPATHIDWHKIGSDMLAATISLNNFGTPVYTPTNTLKHI